MRRRFNDGERVALYLAADGRCARCGDELEPSWHADHVDPFSKGGATEITNGQALCPACNLKKGNKVMELRQWQQNALQHLEDREGDFLVVATPGAGKTTFALSAVRQRLGADVDKVIVVVPTAHLRHQWAEAATRFSVHLDDTFTNGVGAMARDYHGVVITYATVASQPLLWRRICSQHRTLVVLDEVHHAGDAEHLSWGPALREAFELAQRRILLSGTPFRSDGNAIPFVRYDADSKCVADFNYDYGAALLDGGVVRPIEFLAQNSEVRWRNAGSVETAHLDEAGDDVLAKALATALSSSGDWIPSVLAQADAELSRQRQEMPDAGGLVIASDQQAARAYASILRTLSGEEPTLVTSDEADASARIARFASGTSRWIVAVKMVSEGVDIPRLCVGVYATNTRTEMFLRQVVGRFVRKRGEADETSASLFIPSIQPLLRFASQIEATVDNALREDVEQRHREAKEATEPRLFDLVEPLSASPATHHSTIRSAESFSDLELRKAAELIDNVGMPSNVTPAMMAAALRRAGAPVVAGQVVVNAAPPLKRSDEKKALRALVKRLVSRYHNDIGVEYSHIHSRLNEVCGGPIGVATVDQLQHRVDLLMGWLERGEV